MINILAADIQVGDTVLGYGARDIEVRRLVRDGGHLCINPGDMNDMLVLPTDRQVTIIRSN